MPFSCLFYPHRWTGASSQQWFRYFTDYGNGGWTLRCGAFYWSRLRRGEVLKNKQSSDTKLQGRVTGRDRVSFLGFGPVMHMPPEHCHSCTLHSEMVTKSNSNSCVCLDAVPSSYIRLVCSHGRWTLPVYPRAWEQSCNSSWLINTQLKWQLECFLHLFARVFVSFFFWGGKDVRLLHLFVYSLLWIDTPFLLTDAQLFQEFNPETWIPVHWSLRDPTPGCVIAWCFFMKYTGLQKDGAPAPCNNVKPAFIKWSLWNCVFWRPLSVREIWSNKDCRVLV